MEKTKIKIAELLTEKLGIDFDPEQVEISNRLYFYIQEAPVGCAYILHYYRGGFLVEINAKDFDLLQTSQITPETFINNTQWYFGYFWGGGDLFSGGYYTALENKPGLHDVELIRKILTVTEMKGDSLASGKDLPLGKEQEWFDLKQKYFRDNRKEFLRKFNEYFHEKYKYQLTAVLSSESMTDNQAYIYPNICSRDFEIVISDHLCQELMFGEKSIPDPSKFSFVMAKRYSNEERSFETTKDFDNALFSLCVLREWDDEEASSRSRKKKDKSAEKKGLRKLFGF